MKLRQWNVTVANRRGEELLQAVRAGQPAALIINTRSRLGETLLRRVRSGLENRGIHLAEAYAIRQPAVLREAIHALVNRPYRMVIVAGGDGTFTSIVSEFAYREVILGLIPAGTGNSFAQTLGIPLAIDSALDVIAGGCVATIDLGKVNDKYFANVTSIGLTVAATRITPWHLKRLIGPSAYVLAGVYQFFLHQPFQCHLVIDRQERTLQTHQLIIANGRYFGDTMLSENASVTNQKLILYSMTPLERWQLARLWLSIFRHQPAPLPGLEQIIAQEIIVETDPMQYLAIDGEIRGQTPAHFVSAPQALYVMVPCPLQEIP